MDRLRIASPRLPAEKLAYAAIRERILSGQSPFGARLVAEELAAELNISRTPVREALRQLDAEGLIVMRPNRGAVVASFSPDELLDLFEMRAVMEGLAARRASARWTDDAGDQLHVALRRLGRASPADADFMSLHDAFHATICRHSGSDRLVTETGKLRAAVDRHLRAYFSRHETRQGTTEDHSRLTAAIESGRHEHAETTMREHIMQTARPLVRELASPGREASPLES